MGAKNMSTYRIDGENITLKEISFIPMTERLGSININTYACGIWKRPSRDHSGEFGGCKRIGLKRWKKC